MLRPRRVITPEDRKHGYDEGWVGSWREPWHRRPHFRTDDVFRDVDEQFMRMERKMSSAFRDIGFPRWKHCLEELETELPEIVDEGDHKKYQVNLHMGDEFEPRDIRVKLKNRMMTVEAKTEHCSPDGNTRVRHEIQKKFTLPESINVKDVRSVLEPDGVLHIEAPMPLHAIEAPSPEPKVPKEIPILVDEQQPSTSKIQAPEAPPPRAYKHVRENLRHVL